MLDHRYTGAVTRIPDQLDADRRAEGAAWKSRNAVCTPGDESGISQFSFGRARGLMGGCLKPTHTAKGHTSAAVLRLPERTRETDPYRSSLALRDGSATKADRGSAVAPRRIRD